MNLNEFKCLGRKHVWKTEYFGPLDVPVRECQRCGKTEVKPIGWSWIESEGGLMKFRLDWLIHYLSELPNNTIFTYDEYFKCLYLIHPEYVENDEKRKERYKINWKISVSTKVGEDER